MRVNKRHGEREDLAGEHALGDAGQLAAAFVFTAVWILDTFVLKYTTFLNPYVPVGLRLPLGVGVLILAGYLARRGLSTVLGEERKTPTVIRKGVFGVVRHPVYLSEILVYLGLIVLSISLAAVVVWIIAIGFLHYISRHEENLLLARFGEEYRQYMREVPMWIPRFWK